MASPPPLDYASERPLTRRAFLKLAADLPLTTGLVAITVIANALLALLAVAGTPLVTSLLSPMANFLLAAAGLATAFVVRHRSGDRPALCHAALAVVLPWVGHRLVWYAAMMAHPH